MQLSAIPNNHPLSFPLALFALGCCVSLFPGSIKRIAIAVPLEKHRSRSRRNTRHRISILRGLHQNAYSLLLYALWTLVNTFLYSAAAVVLDTIATIVVFRRLDLRLIVIAPAVLGIIVGKAIEFRRLLNQLDKYDQSTEALESELNRLDAPDSLSEVLG